MSMYHHSLHRTMDRSTDTRVKLHCTDCQAVFGIRKWLKPNGFYLVKRDDGEDSCLKRGKQWENQAVIVFTLYGCPLWGATPQHQSNLESDHYRL